MASGAFPSLKFDEDQWGECGYFFDTSAHRFAWYSIDRKNQYDEVYTLEKVSELLAECSAERRAVVEAWLATLPAHRDG